MNCSECGREISAGMQFISYDRVIRFFDGRAVTALSGETMWTVHLRCDRRTSRGSGARHRGKSRRARRQWSGRLLRRRR